MLNRKYAAREIQLYMQARYAGDRVREQRQLEYACGGISSIVGHLLTKEPNWGSDRWVDHIIPRSVAIEGRQSFVLDGFVVWGLVSDIWKQWVEPVEVALRLSYTGRRMPYFRAKLGDAALGIGCVELGVREQLVVRAHPEKHRSYFDRLSGDWIFEIGD